MIKADLSGSFTKVINSTNKAIIGEEGLIVRETTRTFVIIKQNSDLKVLLKEGSVF